MTRSLGSVFRIVESKIFMAYFGIKFTCSSIVANAFDTLYKLLLLPTKVDEEQKDFLGKSGYSFIQRKEKKRMTSKQTLFLVSQPHHCNIPSFVLFPRLLQRKPRNG